VPARHRWLKLYALPSLYRQFRFDRVRIYENDVADLMERYEPDLSAVLDELTDFVSASDLLELRGIVRDIEARMAQSRRRFGNQGS
jgi:hypothetical protein